MARGTGWVALASLAGNAYQAYKNSELWLQNQTLASENADIRAQLRSANQRLAEEQRNSANLLSENTQLRLSLPKPTTKV